MYRNELLALVRVLHQAVREEVLPVLNASQPHMTRDAPDGNAPQGYLASQFMQAIEAALLRAALRCGGLPQWAERMAAQQVRRCGPSGRTDDWQRRAYRLRHRHHVIDAGPAGAHADTRGPCRQCPVDYLHSATVFRHRSVRPCCKASCGADAPKDVAKEIEQITDATASRATFIARDQTSK